MTEHFGPQLAFSEELHATKYRGKGETFKEGCNRQAGALTDDKEHFHDFRDIILNMRFMAGGRVQAAVGSSKGVTPYNCFVSGTIQDSFVQGHGSIMGMATEAATTMRMGGGIGYDFSTLRPSGDLIRKLQSHSSGPISFMSIYDAICKCVASSGHRRGAQMGVMRVDHPDIEEFVHAKQPPEEAQPILEMLGECEPGTAEWQKWFTVLQSVYRLTGFNVSVAVTDKFMRCLRDGKDFPLKFGNKVYRYIDPSALWETIMRSTWDWAEPGVLFIDRINGMNNLWYCEKIAATNPCGEQPLPPYGACLLGSFNLVRYLARRTDGSYYFNWHQLAMDIPSVVRAMDNVIDVASYPLFEQEQEAKNKRRMGLGVTGLANCLEALGYEYGSEEFVIAQEQILEFINRECYRASAHIAMEKGAFPMYRPDKYLEGEFVSSLDDETIAMICQHGIRNSHLTSIAPTGTISATADNVSSGIEPVFAYKQKRLVNMPNGEVEVEFDDYGYRELGVEGRRAQDVTVDEHLRVLTAASRNVDSSVSKTCNVPADLPWADFKNLYMRAWEGGCKGITTFQTGGKRAGIINSADPEAKSSCYIDPETGRHECE